MLTGARYGALITFDAAGGIREFYTSGFSGQQRDSMTQASQGPDLVDHLNRAKGPVRLGDTASHLDHAGLPGGHPAVKNYLGVPVYLGEEHLGNLYLTEKKGGQEFTQEDENLAVMFAAQAASIVFNTRKYEEANQAKKELEALMEISPVAVSVMDTRIGQVTFVNQEAKRILGMMGFSDEGDESSQQYLRVTRTDGREVPFEELPGTRALMTGETVRADEIVIHRPDGSTLTCLVNCAPMFSESGEMMAVLSVMQDMTPLEDVERQRGEFVGLVSQKLMTPLSSIKGSTAALQTTFGSQYSGETLQLLRIIDQQADLMRSQINSLSELTQIETGSLSVAAERTDVGKMLEESCGEYLREHSAISIQLDAPEELPMAMADRNRISQVLHNFLRQAARHSGEAAPLRVSASVTDIYVVVSVSAKGSFAAAQKAISPFAGTDAPQLLEKLTRSHNATAEMSFQDEGLSLAYCRGVVEAHGGRIRQEADEENGELTLSFTLQSVEEVPGVEILNPDEEPVFGEPLPPLAEATQILVSIEDAKLLAAVRRVLTGAGYGMLRASSLGEVDELASSEGAKLILLDIAGREEECFGLLRHAGDSPNIPAIVFCERDDEDYVVRAFDMGADGYMVKPFSSSELVARIRATLRRVNAGGQGSNSKAFRLGDVLINFFERKVSVSGKTVQLTATEYRLLNELANAAGRVLTQDELLHKVWGPEYTGEPQLVRSYVKTLRQKLGDNARKPKYIFTEHGIGYRMANSAPSTNESAPTRGGEAGANGHMQQLNGGSARLQRVPQR